MILHQYYVQCTVSEPQTHLSTHSLFNTFCVCMLLLYLLAGFNLMITFRIKQQLKWSIFLLFKKIKILGRVVFWGTSDKVANIKGFQLYCIFIKIVLEKKPGKKCLKLKRLPHVPQLNVWKVRPHKAAWDSSEKFLEYNQEFFFHTTNT